MLKEGQKKFWGSFSAEAESLSHTEGGGGTKGFHSLKGGGGRKKFYCLEGGAKGFGHAFFSFL